MMDRIVSNLVKPSAGNLQVEEYFWGCFRWQAEEAIESARKWVWDTAPAVQARVGLIMECARARIAQPD